ncbi:hypothetical protein M2272_003098 [Mycobacterium frederiksbergense]|uniref:DUF7847 domain-containing protein n=2 Tax=Mycolicibacterium frederiksbergense TaxID=117567 RepID=A0ABT6L0I3_9MYCO|nr:hypothetical protein [Mycolicibacterium frederiksbergense]MDH6196455.1 hypothetical protein [Mycolicibacterium frederiksbergense]
MAYPPSGYYPPPGDGPCPPPGYGPYPPGYPPGFGYPAALKPGVIPLRPLSLADIFNGAVAYIKKNPKATLGLTTIVVVVAQAIALVLQVGPLAAGGVFSSPLQGEEPTPGTFAVFFGGAFAGSIVTALSAVLLSGMLTVVIGRSIFGGSITIGQAWERMRGRLPALIGLTALEALVVLVVAAFIAFVIIVVSRTGGGVTAFLIGAPLVLVAVIAALCASTLLLFAPVVIVLERLGVFAAIARSFALAKKDFWRILGIWLLATLVMAVIAGAVAVPFSVTGQLLTMGAGGLSLIGLVLSAVGSAIGQIITAPFRAGVVVLLYTDRRIRAEAFDLVLQTGAAGPAESTDQLWLTGRF